MSDRTSQSRETDPKPICSKVARIDLHFNTKDGKKLYATAAYLLGDLKRPKFDTHPSSASDWRYEEAR